MLADSFYGRVHEFRERLEGIGQPYAIMVPKTNAVPLEGHKEKTEQLVERLPEEAYSEAVSVGDCGERRPLEWVCLELAFDPQKGMGRWLLIRRSTDDPDDLSFYQTYGPEDTTLEELIRVCQERWQVEVAFEAAKGEVGMDHYEVRKWESWHRYITLCLLTHAFLVVTCLSARDEEATTAPPKKGDGEPDLVPLTVPEVRSVLLAMAEPDEQKRIFRLRWSSWRRAHQAVARRSKKASLAAKRALSRQRQPSKKDDEVPEKKIAVAREGRSQ